MQSAAEMWREMIRRSVFDRDHGAKAVLLINLSKKQVEVLMGDDRMLLNLGDMIDLNAVLSVLTMEDADVFRGV